MVDRIPVSGPWITEKEVSYVLDAVKNAWYANAGMYNGRFEKAFAAHCGRSCAMSLPSCTSGIHLALLALGVGQGDEVIVPETTWIASAAPITYVGATTVFADIEPDTWCIDPKSVERNITPRTKAVIPVNLYGNMADMDSLLEIARGHSLAVIEDAAQSAGATYRGKPAGGFGDFSVFSFHGSKTLTTGEGGMLLTDRKDLFQRCCFLRDHGRAAGTKMFWNSEVAYKYKMSSLQAALGLAQLERLEELVARKRQIFEWYRHRLTDVPGVTLNCQRPHVRNTYWMVTVILDERYALSKEDLLAKMSMRGIDCRPFFYPLSSLPAYESLPQAAVARKHNAVSYHLSERAINLPSGLNLDEALVDRVCGELISVLKSSEGSR